MANPTRGAGFDYIRHCKDVVASIDPDELGNLEIGELVGRSYHWLGPATSVYALGAVLLGKESFPVALKDDPSTPDRLAMELRDAAILADVVPEIVPKLPHFMGRITLEDRQASLGILTEDATRGASIELESIRLSDETMKLICSAFSPYEDFNIDGLSIDRTTLRENSAFSADGQEKILDLFPNIVDGRLKFNGTNYYTEIYHEADDAQDEVTVKIKNDSALAQSAIELGLID